MEYMYVYTHCASLSWIERVQMSSLRATVCLFPLQTTSRP